MKLTQLILEGVDYTQPNFNEEWKEAIRYPEFKKLGKDRWIELAKTGKAITITSAEDINNTDANEPDAFKTLDPNKQKRALAQLKSGNVEMPIVALYSDGYKELVAGNTRLTAMMAQNKKATIWQFEVPEEIEENYTNDLKEDLSLDKKKDLVRKIAKLVKSSGGHMSMEDLVDLIARKITVDTEKKPAPGTFKVIGGTRFVENVDFTALEKVLDDMFEDLDIDINFTTHFKERVIERGLTEEDIIELMSKIHDQYGDEVADLYRDENRVFTHLKRLVDIAAVNTGYGEDYLKDLVLKTAFKRNSPNEPEFRTNASAPKLKVAEGDSIHEPVRPGILKNQIKGKVTCSKASALKAKQKDKSNNTAKAAQRFLNYHCK